MPEEDNILETITDEIINTGCQQLLAGLTILAKDLSEFLSINAYYGSDTRRFTEMYATTLSGNRFFWKLVAPEVFQPLEENGITDKFAERVMMQNFTMSPLLEESINQEWTRHTGWALLRAFREDFADVLCQPNGLVDHFLRGGEANEQQFILSVAELLLEQKFSDQPYWYPFTVQLSTLIAKTDLEYYYESSQN